MNIQKVGIQHNTLQCTPLKVAEITRLLPRSRCSIIDCNVFIIFGLQALSFSDHYCQSTCRKCNSVITSVCSLFKMHLLRQFLSELDEILTVFLYNVSVWSLRLVDLGLMTSLQRANLIAYRLVLNSAAVSVCAQCLL